jgi:hypothetical protein
MPPGPTTLTNLRCASKVAIAPIASARPKIQLRTAGRFCKRADVLRGETVNDGSQPDTAATKRYPRPETLTTYRWPPRPSLKTRRSVAMWTFRLLSSTTVSGQTRALHQRGQDFKSARSKLEGLPDSISNCLAGRRRKGPNANPQSAETRAVNAVCSGSVICGSPQCPHLRGCAVPVVCARRSLHI